MDPDPPQPGILAVELCPPPPPSEPKNCINCSVDLSEPYNLDNSGIKIEALRQFSVTCTLRCPPGGGPPESTTVTHYVSVLDALRMLYPSNLILFTRNDELLLCAECGKLIMAAFLPYYELLLKTYKGSTMAKLVKEIQLYHDTERNTEPKNVMNEYSTALAEKIPKLPPHDFNLDLNQSQEFFPEFGSFESQGQQLVAVQRPLILSYSHPTVPVPTMELGGTPNVNEEEGSNDPDVNIKNTKTGGPPKRARETGTNQKNVPKKTKTSKSDERQAQIPLVDPSANNKEASGTTDGGKCNDFQSWFNGPLFPTTKENLQLENTTKIKSKSLNTPRASKRIKPNQQNTSIRYPCDQCGDLFLFKYELEAHILDEHEHRIPTECSICQFKCFDPELLTNHFCMKTEWSTSKGRRCLYCGMIFESIHKWVAHRRSHEDGRGKNFVCSIGNCDKKYYTPGVLNVHIRKAHPENKDQQVVHSGSGSGTNPNSEKIHTEHEDVNANFVNGQFRCNACVESFLYKWELNQHILKIHQDQVSVEECEQCGFSCFDEELFTNHVCVSSVQRVVEDLNHRCDYCGHCTQEWLEMDIHKTHHDVENERSKTAQEWNKVVCRDCGKFFRKEYLSAHQIAEHSDLRPYICEICDKMFKYRCLLKAHTKKKHPETRLHECPLCFEAYPSLQELRHHWQGNAHTKEETAGLLNLESEIDSTGTAPITSSAILDVTPAQPPQYSVMDSGIIYRVTQEATEAVTSTQFNLCSSPQATYTIHYRLEPEQMN